MDRPPRNIFLDKLVSPNLFLFAFLQLGFIQAKAGDIAGETHPARNRIAGEGDCAGRPGTGLEVGSRHDRGSVERMA